MGAAVEHVSSKALSTAGSSGYEDRAPSTAAPSDRAGVLPAPIPGVEIFDPRGDSGQQHGGYRIACRSQPLCQPEPPAAKTHADLYRCNELNRCNEPIDDPATPSSLHVSVWPEAAEEDVAAVDTDGETTSVLDGGPDGTGDLTHRTEPIEGPGPQLLPSEPAPVRTVRTITIEGRSFEGYVVGRAYCHKLNILKTKYCEVLPDGSTRRIVVREQPDQKYRGTPHYFKALALAFCLCCDD